MVTSSPPLSGPPVPEQVAVMEQRCRNSAVVTFALSRASAVRLFPGKTPGRSSTVVEEAEVEEGAVVADDRA